MGNLHWTERLRKALKACNVQSLRNEKSTSVLNVKLAHVLGELRTTHDEIATVYKYGCTPAPKDAKPLKPSERVPSVKVARDQCSVAVNSATSLLGVLRAGDLDLFREDLGDLHKAIEKTRALLRKCSAKPTESSIEDTEYDGARWSGLAARIKTELSRTPTGRPCVMRLPLVVMHETPLMTVAPLEAAGFKVSSVTGYPVLHNQVVVLVPAASSDKDKLVEAAMEGVSKAWKQPIQLVTEEPAFDATSRQAMYWLMPKGWMRSMTQKVPQQIVAWGLPSANEPKL